jgi:phage terminase large subunit-like protein
MSAHEKLRRHDWLHNSGEISARAARNIEWIEKHCVVPDGKDMGKPLIVADFMCEDFNLIYRDPDDPRGPVSKALISRPRKNAKSVEAAMIALLALLGPEAQHGTEVYSGAMAREQAAILFKLLSRMIRMSPTLRTHAQIKDSTKEIIIPALTSKYRAMSKDGKTAHGLSPRLVILDEMGQERKETNDLIEALVSGSAAQDDPLIVAISTQAPNDGAWLSKEIDGALTSEDPSIVCRVDGLPLDHPNPFSAEALAEANPAWDVWQNQTYMIQQALEASRMPSKQAAFRNLMLNQRVSADEPFVERAIWGEGGATPTPLKECLSVFGGLDLSETRDLTALVLVGIDEAKKWNSHPTFWLPAEGLAEKSVSDAVPYDRWEEDGYLEATPGRTVDYAYVAERVWEAVERYNIKKIAFDRYNFRHFKTHLYAVGFTEDQIEGDDAIFVPFGQGFVSMSPAIRTLEAAILENKLQHGNHPLLTMCMNNTRLLMDPAGNRKPAKHKSTGRIDGMVSLTMAAGLIGDGDAVGATSSSYLEEEELLVL